MQRLRIPTIVGLCGALAVMIGTVLPWVTLSSPGQPGGDPSISFPAESVTFNGVIGGNGIMLFLGIGVGIAAAWLWAADVPRKAVAALTPSATAVIVFTVWAITAKGDWLGFGGGDPSETVSIRAGVYTTLAGGILALVAAGVAFVIILGARDTAMSADRVYTDAIPVDEAAVEG
jgi:hypothetical protein